MYREPAIICDKCKREHRVSDAETYLFYRWFIDGKSPPGWTVAKLDDGERVDLCPKCRKI